MRAHSLAPIQVAVGDWAARDVATTQPIKLAAIEGLYKTTRGAPEHVLGWYTDEQSAGFIMSVLGAILILAVIWFVFFRT